MTQTSFTLTRVPTSPAGGAVPHHVVLTAAGWKVGRVTSVPAAATEHQPARRLYFAEDLEGFTVGRGWATPRTAARRALPELLRRRPQAS
jgi:hypothetical protein